MVSLSSYLVLFSAKHNSPCQSLLYEMATHQRLNNNNERNNKHNRTPQTINERLIVISRRLVYTFRLIFLRIQSGRRSRCRYNWVCCLSCWRNDSINGSYWEIFCIQYVTVIIDSLQKRTAGFFTQQNAFLLQLMNFSEENFSKLKKKTLYL